MPSLAELSDLLYPQQDNTLPVEQPYLGVPQDTDGLRRIYINTGNVDQSLPIGSGAPAQIAPQTTDINGDMANTPNATGFFEHPLVKQLLGLGGEERYQLWPERLVREALSVPHDVMTGKIPVNSVDPDTGEVNTSPQLIAGAQAISALAGTGGLAGADASLGSTAFLRPALKYENKIYKAPIGGQHLDALPAHLADDFQAKAMNGEDINSYNFGFMNHKGQFLDREKALDYAIKEGLVDQSAGQYGALTSTLMADSSKPGTAIESLAKSRLNQQIEIKNLIQSAKNRNVDLDASYDGYGPYNLHWIESKGIKAAPREGTKVIKELSDLADKNNKEIQLVAIADAEEGGDYLPKYYKALGFKPTSKLGEHPDGIEMVRKPYAKMDKVLAAKLLLADSSKPGTAIEAMAKTQPKISYDNPGGDWLKYKQEDALAKRKFTNGSPTAFARDVALPTELLDKVKGLKDENRVAGDYQYDALLKEVKEKGWKNDSPILIKVNHFGQPYISEGNTRVAVAKAIGQKTVPAWVDWMNGAETTAGPWHPDNIKPLMTSTKDKYKLVPVEGDPFK